MSDCTRKLVLLFIKTCTKITFWKDSISQTKLNYYSGIICSNDGNSKLLFSLLNNILRPPASLPPHLYSTAFCNSMMSFFNQKIHQIHLYLGPSSSPEPCLTSQSFSFFQLEVQALHQSVRSPPHSSGESLPPLSAPPHLCHHPFLTLHWNCSYTLQNWYHHSNIEKTCC